ncbi:hypothetical protein V1514DRAFT_303528 [Lipomyces japonicus]|uniref:uncharacterized protein n=1 Tax=Lipomyces japonicus TaxID=56871 RepID=UPI0034CE2742
MATSIQWSGSVYVRGSSESLRLFLLTICVAGLQFTWGVEQSYVNVYLLSLGLSKSLLSSVWIAGPLSGLIMQPVVGAWSDNCTSSFGRRRPFMIIGSIIVSLSLMLMAWTREFIEFFVDSESWTKPLTISFAVLSVFTADFAVSAVQACCRAIIVDTLPKSKQELGNAWAGRMVAGGHLIGYFLGFIDLVAYFPFLGSTQLKVLCAISSIALLVSIAITSWAVNERVLVTVHSKADTTLRGIFNALFTTGLHLPLKIRRILTVQLFAWYGWFTFLFYSSTWVGEIYVRYEAPELSDSLDIVGDIGRVGSRALTIYSTVTLFCSLILPFFVVSPSSDSHHQLSTYADFPKFIGNFLVSIAPYRPTLSTAWMISHIVYAFAMFGSIFVHSVRAATIIVGICGFSWALTAWAPFSLLAEEIRKISFAESEYSYESLSASEEDIGSFQENDNTISIGFAKQNKDVVRPGRAFDNESSSSGDNGMNTIEDELINDSIVDGSSLYEENADIADEEFQETSERAGIFLGLLNVSITVPQFVSTFVSFIIFSILEPGKSTELSDHERPNKEGVNAIGVTLQVGGLTALIAAYMTHKLRTS